MRNEIAHGYRVFWHSNRDHRVMKAYAFTGGIEANADEYNHRIYISGDTLLVDDLKQIPERYKGQNIDLMLAHLGGTTIPSPSLPLLMVTMNAEQGLGLVRLIDPDLTIPIHYE